MLNAFRETSALFQPLRIGLLSLTYRVNTEPLTRSRSIKWIPSPALESIVQDNRRAERAIDAEFERAKLHRALRVDQFLQEGSNRARSGRLLTASLNRDRVSTTLNLSHLSLGEHHVYTT